MKNNEKNEKVKGGGKSKKDWCQNKMRPFI